MALIDELEGAAMELPRLEKENASLKKKIAQYKRDIEGLQIDAKVYRDNIKGLEKQVAELRHNDKPQTSKYGEPLTVGNDYQIRDSNGTKLTLNQLDALCVLEYAMRGIADPQNLRNALEAYLGTIDSNDPQCQHINQQALQTIRAMMEGK